jgi:hypothetical protein
LSVFPGSGHALHARLTAQLAFSAHLAGHARHFGCEGAELVDHGVHHLADAEEFALQPAPVDLGRHVLRQIAFGHGADHARDLGGRLDHVVDEFVDRIELRLPAARGAFHLRAIGDVAFLAHDPRDAVELARDALVETDDVVEERSDLPVAWIGRVQHKPNRKIALAELCQRYD